ncbi:MAG TPA: glutamate carboxypeptidase [Negativicutes bacterium]|nr:glutamate carboxypeptidase [Negativicutes bacterium]
MKKHILLLAFLLVSSVCFAAPDPAVLEKANNAEASYLANLETLVNIDTGTGYKDGLIKAARILEEKLKDVGATVEVTPAADNIAGENIRATWEGTGKGKILLLTHLDTVYKTGTVASRPFKVEGRRAYGPGVSDEKSGIALGLEVMRILQEIGYANFAKVTWLINPDEEKGSFGSRELIMKEAQLHDYTLCLEPGGSNDTVTVWRKGIGYYILNVKGKAAHAGGSPEKGLNAAMEIAHQVLQLSNLNDPKKGTTLNWTVIKAGGASNVIPEDAMAQADVRVLYPEEYDRLSNDINRIIKNKLIPDTIITFEPQRGRPPFPKNDKTDALAVKMQAIYAELGKELATAGSGGGSDANYAASVGAVAIDGLGPVGGKGHTDEEYVELDSIASRIYLLARAIMDLGAGK